MNERKLLGSLRLSVASNILIILPVLVFLSFSRIFFLQSPVKYGAFVVLFLVAALVALIISTKKIRVEVYCVAGSLVCVFLVLWSGQRLYEDGYFYVLMCILIFILYYLLINFEVGNNKNALFFIGLLSVAMLCFLILEVLQRYYGIIFFTDIKAVGDELQIKEFYRLTGSTSNPNRWAASLAIPTYVSLFAYLKVRSKSLLFLFLILSIYGVLSFSKTYILTYIITCAIILLVLRKTKYLLVLGVGAFLIVSTWGFSFSDEAVRIFHAQVEIIKSPLGNPTIQNRVESYGDAIQSITEHPLIGVPKGTLEISPHNNLLAYVAYYGLLGVVAYLIIFIIPLLLFVRRATCRRDKWAMTFVLLGGLLSTSMSSLATDVSTQLMYILGLIVSTKILSLSFWWSKK